MLYAQGTDSGLFASVSIAEIEAAGIGTLRGHILDNPDGTPQDIVVPISQLKPGRKGIVIRLDGESGLRQHLLEMGFTKGTEVEFIRQAPLGDPVDLRLRGYRLSLRRSEASAVIVTPTSHAPVARPSGRG